MVIDINFYSVLAKVQQLSCSSHEQSLFTKLSLVQSTDILVGHSVKIKLVNKSVR